MPRVPIEILIKVTRSKNGNYAKLSQSQSALINFVHRKVRKTDDIANTVF